MELARKFHNFVWNRIGRTKCTHRVSARDGAHQPLTGNKKVISRLHVSKMKFNYLRKEMELARGFEPPTG